VHTDVEPDIAPPDVGLTVTFIIVIQPVPSPYVIPVIPALFPVTTPAKSTVAIAGLPLDHAPPGTTFESVVVPPRQTVVRPVIAGGTGFTVITASRVQPVPGIVYVIVAVPTLIPVSTPVAEPIMATTGAELDHTPPGVALLNIEVLPSHTCIIPEITDGNG
jgi:hypothetical protein